MRKISKKMRAVGAGQPVGMLQLVGIFRSLLQACEFMKTYSRSLISSVE